MALPPSEELSRWTLGHVNNWLSQSSLSVFRECFLRDGIDGSKLLRMQPHDVDARYNTIPARKRQILKDHLSKIESPRSPPSWSTAAAAGAPQLPPRPGPRAPPPVSQQPDEGDGSDDGWGSDDFEDDIDEEYLEPTTTPAHIKEAFASAPAPAPVPGRVNGHHRQRLPEPEEPQSEYEIPAEDLENIAKARQPASTGLQRKASLIDRLKNELEVRKRDSQVDVEEATPPPRPPRMIKAPEGPAYTNTLTDQSSASHVTPQLPAVRHRPQPAPPTQSAQKALPPENEYEIVNDTPREPEKSMEKKEPRPAPSSDGGGGDMPLPPRPEKKMSTEKPPQPPPQQGGWLFNNEQATVAPKTANGDDLNEHSWYHGKISRDHAQKIFQREQKDGMFLIRKSERDPQQPYTLVIWHCNRIWNIPIRKLGDDKFAAGKFKPGETHFSAIVDLVEHFKVVSLNLKSDDQVQGTHNLTVPAPKQ